MILRSAVELDSVLGLTWKLLPLKIADNVISSNLGGSL